MACGCKPEVLEQRVGDLEGDADLGLPPKQIRRDSRTGGGATAAAIDGAASFTPEQLRQASQRWEASLLRSPHAQHFFAAEARRLAIAFSSSDSSAAAANATRRCLRGHAAYDATRRTTICAHTAPLIARPMMGTRPMM